MSTTVRLTPETRQTLKTLDEKSGETMQAVLDRLIAREQEKLFWHETNAAYAALRADVSAWGEELAERAMGCNAHRWTGRRARAMSALPLAWRGEVWIANLDLTQGHEQADQCPCVVVSTAPPRSDISLSAPLRGKTGN